MARMTRKISRNIARANMKRHGILHPHKHHVYRNIHGLLVHEPSFFAAHWREYLIGNIKAARSRKKRA